MSRDQGMQFAHAHGCLFVETSAKCNVAVDRAFEELVQKVGGLAGAAARAALAFLAALPRVDWLVGCCEGVAPSAQPHRQHCSPAQLPGFGCFADPGDPQPAGLQRQLLWLEDQAGAAVVVLLRLPPPPARNSRDVL